MHQHQAHLSLWGLCFAKAEWEDSCMFDTSDKGCTRPPTGSDPHSSPLSPWLHWLLLVPGLITSHFPTINCISHLPACNPDKSKAFWMSLFCSSPHPTPSASFYVISRFQALLKLHFARGHCTHFNSTPPPQHISALIPFWFIYTVYYQSPIQSIKAGIQTHAHTHSSGDRRQLLWPRSFL